METYFLKSEDISRFCQRIEEEFDLYLPVKSIPPFALKCAHNFILPVDDFRLGRYPAIDKEEAVFNPPYRCQEPLRAFFTRYKEKVCGYFAEGAAPRAGERPVAVCGVKNCDLFSLKIQDFVFLGGVAEDPLYKARRGSALIISGDCSSFKEACFCRALGINPHPSEGFDFNFSALNNGYLVDAATEKAKGIIASLPKVFVPAGLAQISGRSVKRESLISRLDEHLKPHQIPAKETLREITLAGYNSAVWQEEMRTCVECNGCVFACDTCHCFLLADQPAEAGGFERLRLWDGCLLKNFSRVAGGANPLRLRYMRLRNRYLKKFDFFTANTGMPGCCGCGRCIEVCPGKIDIRRILKRLSDEKYLPAS